MVPRRGLEPTLQKSLRMPITNWFI